MQDFWNDPPEAPEPPEWYCKIQDKIQEARDLTVNMEETTVAELRTTLSEITSSLCNAVEMLFEQYAEERFEREAAAQAEGEAKQAAAEAADKARE